MASRLRAAGALLARPLEAEEDGVRVQLGSEAEREILERHGIPAEVERELARRGLPYSVRLEVAPGGRSGSPALDEAELVRRAEARLRRTRAPAGPKPLWSWGGEAAGDVVPISDCREPGPRVVVEGRVFETEVRELRGGRAVALAFLTDGADSIAVRVFGEAADVKELAARLEAGPRLRARGTLELEPRSSQLVLRAEGLSAFPAPRREDAAVAKRVELHAHTRMSAMDGTADVARLVARAAAWGHEAVGVVDHGVVQAFPEAALAARRHGIKVLYGMEAYLVDDRPPVVLRPDGRPAAGEFVALDLETTGLSPRSHAIVEIGAVRFRGGEPAERFHTFVDPGRDLSEKARELTGITEDMLRGAPRPGPAVERLLAFVGDLPVVAHNAAFDLGFVHAAAQAALGRPFRPPAVDTMWLARALLPELSSHGLAQVTEALGVSLPRHHRAEGDALATGLAFLRLVARAGESCGLSAAPTLEELAGLSRLVPARLVRPVQATVFAKSPEGLGNLYRLVTESHLEHFHRVPRIPRSVLSARRAGLVVGSGGPASEALEAWLAGEPEEEWTARLRFYDFLELVPQEALESALAGQVDDEAVKAYHRALLAAGDRLGLPVLAVGDVHHLDPEDAACREVLLVSQRAEDEPRRGVHLRTTEEMLAAFRHLGEPEAERVVVREPVAFARSFPELSPLPEGLSAPELEGAAERVTDEAYARARELYGDPLPRPVAERLEEELAMIVGHGYAALYAIAARLVARSLADGYLVGSRGSVGSSLVATLLGITEVNPLPPHYVCPACRWAEFAGLPEGVRSGFDLPPRPCPKCGRPMRGDGHDIPFASFLGFEGDKVPDIDLNFSGEYQARAHQAAEELLGPGSVYRAGTIATVAERTAYGLVRAYAESSGRELSEAEVRRLVRGLTGVKRTTGQHPGGLMVVPRGRDPHEFTPLQRPANDPGANVTTHFDYHAIEGRLVKLDLLGHDDPTALKLLHEMTGVDPREVPFSDEATRAIFRGRGALGLPEREGEVGTLGIPEFGTRFVRGMLLDTRPATFAELVRISGLSHGTDVWANNARELTREGTATLSEVIATRDDLYLYLIERGMEPKRAFDIGERVRKGRGLGPEDEEAMRALGIPGWYVESCRKITYLFPKAHAVAYVMMAFRIAWYKVHRPAAFYAAHFTIHAGDFDPAWASLDAEACRRLAADLDRVGAPPKERQQATLLELIAEMRERGLGLLPIDLTRSEATRFRVEPEGAERAERPEGAGVRIPFVAAPGLGEKAARQLCEERARGAFRSRAELRERAGLGRAVLDVLERVGALAGLPEDDQIALF
ncbi:MAG: PolC-type DNA polymerase III [Clostridia bacterium]|nr:PolC-type DNA polymerase III [Clostridia bacterium]